MSFRDLFHRWNRVSAVSTALFVNRFYRFSPSFTVFSPFFYRFFIVFSLAILLNALYLTKKPFKTATPSETVGSTLYQNQNLLAKSASTCPPYNISSASSTQWPKLNAKFVEKWGKPTNFCFVICVIWVRILIVWNRRWKKYPKVTGFVEIATGIWRSLRRRKKILMKIW